MDGLVVIWSHEPIAEPAMPVDVGVGDMVIVKAEKVAGITGGLTKRVNVWEQKGLFVPVLTLNVAQDLFWVFDTGALWKCVTFNPSTLTDKITGN